jgi:hypothetical protein
VDGGGEGVLPSGDLQNPWTTSIAFTLRLGVVATEDEDGRVALHMFLPHVEIPRYAHPLLIITSTVGGSHSHNGVVVWVALAGGGHRVVSSGVDGIVICFDVGMLEEV